MFWILIFLAAVVPSAIAHPVDAQDSESYSFAYNNTPEYRFDSGAKALNCWPDAATKESIGKCSDFNVNAPAYYTITDCQGKYRKLSWWLWFGKVQACNNPRPQNDWEHININFIKNDAGKWVKDSVTFHQFDGWYTRKYTAGPVVVFVGKVRHGQFDNWCPEEKCHEPCEYWNDYRDDKPNGVHWFPLTIKDVSLIPKKFAKVVHDHKYFACHQSNSCFGSDIRCTVGSCGCYRNDHTFPAPYCDK